MSHPLESFVNSVKTLTAQGNFSCLCEFLHSSTALLSKQGAHLDTVLAALTVEQHSLGWLTALLAKFAASDAAAETNIERQMREFVADCAVDQIRYSPDLYAELCHVYTRRLLEAARPIQGLAVLRRAIDKIQADPSQLTSIHADLCQLALAAKCFRPALDLLDVDIADISKENGKLNARPLLLYYYYGGMIYAAVKRFERAAYFFEIYYMVPALTVSSIMVEAFKKHQLVSLILSVETRRPAKSRYHEALRQGVTRRVRPLCLAYVELASAFTAAGSTEQQLNVIVARHQEQYVRDDNLGLVKQCLAAHRKMTIQRLTKTFLTLSLSDVASRVQLADARAAELQIVRMIDEGDICAAVNQRDGMVRFLDRPQEYGDAGMLARLEREMADIMALERRVQTLDEEIQLNPQYVQKCHKTQEEDSTAQACSSSSSQNNKPPYVNMI